MALEAAEAQGLNPWALAAVFQHACCGLYGRGRADGAAAERHKLREQVAAAAELCSACDHT